MIGSQRKMVVPGGLFLAVNGGILIRGQADERLLFVICLEQSDFRFLLCRVWETLKMPVVSGDYDQIDL